MEQINSLKRYLFIYLIFGRKLFRRLNLGIMDLLKLEIYLRKDIIRHSLSFHSTRNKWNKTQ